MIRSADEHGERTWPTVLRKCWQKNLPAPKLKSASNVGRSRYLFLEKIGLELVVSAWFLES